MRLDLVGDELDQIDSIWGRTRWGRTRHGAKPAATKWTNTNKYNRTKIQKWLTGRHSC